MANRSRFFALALTRLYPWRERWGCWRLKLRSAGQTMTTTTTSAAVIVGKTVTTTTVASGNNGLCNVPLGR